jgi:hypothetical protein
VVPAVRVVLPGPRRASRRAAFNLIRAAATLACGELARATTATVRRKVVNVAARTASSGRRITVHLPTHWPWESAWSRLFFRVCGPPTAVLT